MTLLGLLRTPQRAACRRARNRHAVLDGALDPRLAGLAHDGIGQLLGVRLEHAVGPFDQREMREEPAS